MNDTTFKTDAGAAAVQAYLLAALERDASQLRVASAEKQRVKAANEASEYLRKHGPVLTEVNHGPNYVMSYNGGTINYEPIKPLFDRDEN